MDVHPHPLRLIRRLPALLLTVWGTLVTGSSRADPRTLDADPVETAIPCASGRCWSTIRNSSDSKFARSEVDGVTPVRIDGMSCQTISPSRSAQ